MSGFLPGDLIQTVDKRWGNIWSRLEPREGWVDNKQSTGLRTSDVGVVLHASPGWVLVLHRAGIGWFLEEHLARA